MSESSNRVRPQSARGSRATSLQVLSDTKTGNFRSVPDFLSSESGPVTWRQGCRASSARVNRHTARAVEWAHETGRADRRHRATHARVGQGRPSRESDQRYSRGRNADGDGRGFHDGRCESIPVRARVRDMGRTRAETDRLGRQGKLHSISKRGDTYLRTLLIHGARSVLAHSKEPSQWVEQISKRRPPNFVIVALVNKTARTIWAVLAHDRVRPRVIRDDQRERNAIAAHPPTGPCHAWTSRVRTDAKCNTEHLMHHVPVRSFGRATMPASCSSVFSFPCFSP